MLGADGHEIAPRELAGELQRGGVRGRPVFGEFHHVGAVDDLEEALGAFELDCSGPGEVRSEGQ